MGLVLDDQRVAWGTCVAASSSSLADQVVPFRAAESRTTIEKTVAPALKGQPLTGFRQLASEIDTLTQEIIVTRPQPKPEQQQSGFSRRDLFTGQLEPAEPRDDIGPPVEHVMVERPIHPAIRYGLSQALLAAMATVYGTTMAEVISSEYNLMLPSSPVPLQATIRRGQRMQLFPQVVSLGYSIAGADPQKELGSNGEKVQRFVRQLRERISEVTEQTEHPAIHLNVRGGLGQLYDNDPGKILGALYGLQQAAAPCSIRVEDPVLIESGQDQIKIKMMSQLVDYLRLRRLSLQLVAGSGMDSLADVQAFLEAQAPAAHMIHLELPRLGSIHETIMAIMACQERGIAVLLDGAPIEIASIVALATQADLLAAAPDQVDPHNLALAYNEMNRTLAGITARREHMMPGDTQA